MNTVLSSKPAGRAAEPRIQHVVVVRARESASTATSCRPTAASSRPRPGPHARLKGCPCPPVSRAASTETCWPPARFTDHENCAQCRRFRRELLRHRPVIEALDRIGDDVRDGARSAQEMPDLGVPVRAQRGDRNGADPRQCKVRVDEFRNVRKLDHDAVERPDSRVDEAARKAVDGLAQCPVTDPLAAMDQRGLVRRTVYHPRQQVGQRDALPIAEIAVLFATSCGHGVHPASMGDSCRQRIYTRQPYRGEARASDAARYVP